MTRRLRIVRFLQEEQALPFSNDTAPEALAKEKGAVLEYEALGALTKLRRAFHALPRRCRCLQGCDDGAKIVVIIGDRWGG
jgi:hypothetical protein